VIVQVPVDAGPRVKGVVGKAELLPGVYMAESLVKVENGCIITSIINTKAVEVELSDQVVKLEET
jgi:molybdopterin-binding protein